MTVERILCVDDDPGMRAVLVRALEQAGYSTDTAMGAAEARERIGSTRSTASRERRTSATAPAGSASSASDRFSPPSPRKGYPRRLSGDHWGPLPEAEALRLIASKRGQEFDPAAVDALLA